MNWFRAYSAQVVTGVMRTDAFLNAVAHGVNVIAYNCQTTLGPNVEFAKDVRSATALDAEVA